MTVLYFSGCGNSLAAAKKIGGRLINIADCTEKSIEDDAIGIVCPIYCSDAPYVVLRFIENTEIIADYIFVVTTRGGAEGRVVNSIAYILAKKGKKVDYYARISMPDTCILFATPKEEQNRLLSEFDAKTAKIKSDVEKRVKTEIKPIKPKRFGTVLMWFGMKKLMFIDRKKTTDACTKCGVCVKTCPMHNITLTDKVRFGKNCENCFGCIQHCPSDAIRFGFLKTDSRTKYYYKEKNNGNLGD